MKPKEVVAVVGGSGSGKTTLGRAIAGLIPATTGEITFDGRSVGPGRRDRDYRLNCQMIFQDPFSSLDPRMTIGVIVGQPLRLVPNLDAVERDRRVASILSNRKPSVRYHAYIPRQRVSSIREQGRLPVLKQG